MTPRRRAVQEAHRIVDYWHDKGHDHVWVRIERRPVPNRPHEYLYPLVTNLRNGRPPRRRGQPGSETGGVHASIP